MFDKAPPPPHPAQLKRALLLHLVDGWAASLARETEVLRADAAAPLRIALVDAFAAAGHQRPPADLRSDGCWSDPPALVRALDAAARRLAAAPGAVAANAVFVEEDPVKVGWLRAALEAEGLGARVATTLDAAPGAIVLLEGRPAEAGLWQWLHGRRALICLDPAGPAQLPLDEVRALAAGGGAELVVGLPLAPLRRAAADRGMAIADLPPYARRVVEGYLRLVGTAADLGRWWGAEQASAEGVSRALVEYYVERLRGLDPDRDARGWPLALAGAPDEPHALCLLTTRPELLLRMNEAVHAAREAGLLDWPDAAASAVVGYHEGTPLELFGHGAVAASGGRVRAVDLRALAHAIAKRFRGRTVGLGAVQRFAAEHEVFADEVRRALAMLRRDGRVLYPSLAVEGAQLAFPRQRTAPPRGRARRPAADELTIPWEEPE